MFHDVDSKHSLPEIRGPFIEMRIPNGCVSVRGDRVNAVKEYTGPNKDGDQINSVTVETTSGQKINVLHSYLDVMATLDEYFAIDDDDAAEIDHTPSRN